MKRLAPSLLAVVISVVLWAVPVTSQTYKWVDDHGTLHFSDVRPRAVGVEEVPLAPSEATREPPSGARNEAIDATPEATAARPQKPQDAPGLTRWTLPLALPGSDQQFRLALPDAWQPLDRATLDRFQERIHQAGGDVRFSSGFLAEGNRFLMIGFHDAVNPAAVVARLPTLPDGWAEPSDLPVGKEVFDAERGVVWSRNQEDRSESVSAMVILGNGVLDILLVTPRDTYPADLRAMARAMTDLELPPLAFGDSGVGRAGGAPDTTSPESRPDRRGLAARVTSIRETRGAVAGIGAALLLLIVWPLLERVEGRALRAVLQGVAALVSFLVVPVLANFWGADPASGGESWFSTLLVLGIPLTWILRRRAARALPNGRRVGIA